MEFTKEQKELFQKALTEYRNSDFLSFADWADSLLRPETKFINVRIEYWDPICCVDASIVKSALKTSYGAGFEVTELSEVFTREEVTKLRDDVLAGSYFHTEIKKVFNKFLERNKS